MPWYAPIFLAGLGLLMLWASRHAEAWMAASQSRARRVFRTSQPQPGTFRARSLTVSHRFAKWFLVLAAVYFIVGAVVTAVIVVA